MNTIILYILTFALATASTISFAQLPVKQYCGGNNGSVNTPAHALGNNLSNHSTLKLRKPSSKKDHVYQNFVFSLASGKDARIVFVVQTDEAFDLENHNAINLKFYTTTSGRMYADTLDAKDIQITQMNKGFGLYEFSFIAANNFDTAGILLQGGGVFRMAKIYKVYLAIHKNQTSPFQLVTASI